MTEKMDAMLPGPWHLPRLHLCRFLVALAKYNAVTKSGIVKLDSRPHPPQNHWGGLHVAAVTQL